MTGRVRSRAQWFYVGALLLAPFLLFHDVLGAYWRADDPAILLHALSAPGLSAFYDPLVWRRLSPSNLTPWLTLSFQVDHALWGPTPSGFYLHQLLACSAVAIAAYRLALYWTRPLCAFLGAALFLCGASTASVVDLLMTRHYLEGLLFSLLGLLAFLRALEGGGLRWACVGALAYALAVTAKEVYVPLVMILLAVPHGRPQDRLGMAWPFLVVAFLYVAWRGYMLGSLVGGYSAGPTPVVPLLNDAAGAALKLPGFVLGPHWIWLALPFAALLMARAIRKPRFALLAAVVALAVLLPLIPLVRSPGITGADRYTFVLWFVLCMAATHAMLPMGRRRAAQASALALAVFAGASLAYQQTQRQAHLKSHREFEEQGRFIEKAEAADGMVPSDALLAGYWYVTGLQGLRSKAGLAGPVMLIRGLPSSGSIRALYRYDPSVMQMRRVQEPTGAFIAQWTASDTTAPLSVDLRLYDASAQWTLGPNDQGQYFMVSGATGRYPIPREGSVKIVFDTLSFQIQHQAPEGRLTASPVFNVRPGDHVSWTRP
ncbi:MAG: hypothetical protein EOO27_11250 [Comamonadaceae bacterium]|nr:MAG: hypothetical protein EOO27_11250 [Comamonadaceae bacterium]